MRKWGGNRCIAALRSNTLPRWFTSHVDNKAETPKLWSKGVRKTRADCTVYSKCSIKRLYWSQLLRTGPLPSCWKSGKNLRAASQKRICGDLNPWLQNIIQYRYNSSSRVESTSHEQHALCMDIAKLSEERQTFKVEAVYSLVNHFTNKMYVYS